MKNLFTVPLISIYSLTIFKNIVYFADGRFNGTFNIFSYDLITNVVKIIRKNFFPVTALGITNNGSRLIMCGYQPNLISTYDFQKGGILLQYFNKGLNGVGACFGSIHVVNDNVFFVGNGLLYNISKITLNCKGTSLNSETTFSVLDWTPRYTSIRPYGIAFDGKYLYTCDAAYNKIIRADASNNNCIGKTTAASIIDIIGIKPYKPRDILLFNGFIFISDQYGIKKYRVSNLKIIFDSKIIIRNGVKAFAKYNNHILGSVYDMSLPNQLTFDSIAIIK